MGIRMVLSLRANFGKTPSFTSLYTVRVGILSAWAVSLIDNNFMSYINLIIYGVFCVRLY